MLETNYDNIIYTKQLVQKSCGQWTNLIDEIYGVDKSYGSIAAIL